MSTRARPFPDSLALATGLLVDDLSLSSKPVCVWARVAGSDIDRYNERGFIFEKIVACSLITCHKRVVTHPSTQVKNSCYEAHCHALPLGALLASPPWKSQGNISPSPLVVFWESRRNSSLRPLLRQNPEGFDIFDPVITGHVAQSAPVLLNYCD